MNSNTENFPADRPVPGSDVEVLSFAVILTTQIPDVAPALPVRDFTDARSTRSQLVRDTSTGEIASWAVYDRATMTAGARISGPAIICEDETSTLVGASWTASANNLGYLELVRETG